MSDLADALFAELDKFVEDSETTLQPGDITKAVIMERHPKKTYDQARRIFDAFKRAHPEYTLVRVKVNGKWVGALRKPVSSVT